MKAKKAKSSLPAPGQRQEYSVKSYGKLIAAVLILSGGYLSLFLTRVQAAAKIYWHFTLEARIDGGKAEEMVWVTMVEMTKEEVLPELADKVKKAGGAVPGTVLAHVRGAAWRSDFTYGKDRKCKGRPSKIEISWKESWSNLVFAHGRVLDPSRDRANQLSLFDFKFGLCDEQVLLEDGHMHDVAGLVSPLIGPINLGGEHDEMPEKVRVQGITYDDMLVHYKHCGRIWTEQATTPLMHYAMENLDGGFMETPDSATGIHIFNFHGHTIDVIYHVDRSTSRDHPEWKKNWMPRP